MTNAVLLASAITSNGNLNLTTSNAGVVFNNSSATVNSTLNDYETGTWTPTWSVSGGTISTPAFANGTYTKIGNTVYIRGYLSYGGSVTGSPSGALAMSGLPFTPGTGFGQSSTFAGGITILAGGIWASGIPQYAQILPGTTTTSSLIYRASSGTGGTATVYTDMNTGASNYSQFIFQGQYTV